MKSMSDSLVLKGVKGIQKHTGNEMQLAFCKRGGDTHMLKRWWTNSPKNIVYIACTVFNVSGPDGIVKLAIESKTDSQIKIDYDGNYNFTFSGINRVTNAALFTADFKLIEYYQISSGVGVAPKIVPGEIARPTFIGELAVSGGPDELNVNTNSGNIEVSLSGNANAVTYAWSKVSGPGQATFTAASQAKTKVKFNEEGTYTIKCTVASSDTGLTDSSPKSVNVSGIVVS